MTSLTVSVAIPTFNGARHLAESIRSILQQDEPFEELRILDDRSDDDTLDVARAEAGDRAQIEVNSERFGLARNWNRCVERAHSALVSVFHQDDVMRPDHLARHRSLFQARPDLGFSCGGFEIIDAEGRRVPESAIEGPSLGPALRIFEAGDFVRELAVRNPVRCSSVVLNRAAHQEMGGFDPRYRYAVDWEYWARVSRKWPVGWVPEPTVSIRWHEDSETHRFRRGTSDLEEVGRVIEHIASTDLHRWPDGGGLQKEGRGRLARAYLNRAYVSLKGGHNHMARRCLRHAWRLSPRMTARELVDPRLMGRFVLSTLRIRPIARE